MTDSARVGHDGDVVIAADAPEQVQQTPTFHDVYYEHIDFVYRAVRRLGVPERNADDAAQDVFVVVHRQLEGFEGRSTLKTWLYGICRRVAKDHRRRAERKEKGQTSDDGLVARSRGPEEATARSEAAAIALGILASMSEAKREVFLLAEMEQMTAPEIADALGINLNTVYSRLRVAREEFEAGVARHKQRGTL